MNPVKRLAGYLDTGIWEIRLQDHRGFHAVLIRYMRTLVLAYRNFKRNDSIRTASVLTYYSVLNFVPLVAVVFAIAKGFGLRRVIEGYIVQMADSAHLQPEMANQIILFSNSLLKQARGGVIAGIGTVLLLWTVISILGKIEDSFNRIWEVKKPRKLIPKFSDYMSILVVTPILFALSASATVLLTGQVKTMMKDVSFLGSLSSGAIFLIGLLPYVSIWVLLIVLYIVMPNTRVSIRSGLLAGIIAGTGFQLIQFVYLKLQMGIAGHGTIYASFAAVPLFLGWLQISWTLVLFGAEIAHTAEYSDTFGFNPDYSRIGAAARRLFLIKVLHLVARRFRDGEKPLDARQISVRLKIPVKLVEDTLGILKDMGLIVEVIDENRNDAFHPAKPLEDLTVQSVLDAYERMGDELPPARSDNDQMIRQLSEALKGTGDLRIRDL